MKLDNTQREHIKVLYNKGKGMSVRKLSQTYGVSRSTIHYIVHPEAYEVQKERARKNKNKGNK